MKQIYIKIALQPFSCSSVTSEGAHPPHWEPLHRFIVILSPIHICSECTHPRPTTSHRRGVPLISTRLKLKHINKKHVLMRFKIIACVHYWRLKVKPNPIEKLQSWKITVPYMQYTSCNCLYIEKAQCTIVVPGAVRKKKSLKQRAGTYRWDRW